jgi:hypothetical protein
MIREAVTEARSVEAASPCNIARGDTVSWVAVESLFYLLNVTDADKIPADS